MTVKTQRAIQKHNAVSSSPKPPIQHSRTKQAMLISLLRRSEGAAMDEIVAATGWLTHTARGAMSGALGKKLGLVVASLKEKDRGRVYRIAKSE